MINLVSERGKLGEDVLLMETLSSIKRAGADMIFTYSAFKAASLLNSKSE
jgi:porphobilinogen synthase